MDAILALGLIFLGLVAYFLPSVLAHFRKHHQENAIVLLNLFLGWTFIGWVAALVWAAMAIKTEAAVPVAEPTAAKPLFPKLIATLIAIGAVVIGGGYTFYSTKQKEQAKEDTSAQQSSPAPQVSSHPDRPIEFSPVDRNTHATAYLPLDNMVVPLADAGGERLAQIGITLVINDGGEAQKVNGFLPSIRSGVLMLISQRTAAELLSATGKEKLKNDILREASLPFGGDTDDSQDAKTDSKPSKDKPDHVEYPVSDVLFSSFVVQ